MGVIRRTNEEWLVLYERQRASGKTLKAWCEENEIKVSTMADRITRLRKMGLTKGAKPPGGRYSTERAVASSWVEVNGANGSFCCGDEQPSKNGIEISIGEYGIHVREGFHPATLTEVCKVLVSLC